MTPFRSSLRIETAKASRNKYSYDPEQGIFVLRKVLPEGMVFPHDFGFLPRTLASDGDPIDVLTELEAFFELPRPGGQEVQAAGLQGSQNSVRPGRKSQRAAARTK
jgi:inorganic pyrophosphatase